MPSFLDLLPGGERVAVPNGEVDAVGLSVEGLGVLVLRFPEIVDQLFAGKINPAALAATAPKGFAVFLAAGMGFANDERAEQWAAKLPLWAQVNLCEGILRQTMGGDDWGPFVAKLRKLAKLVGLETKLKDLQSDLAKTPDQSSPSPPESPTAKGEAVSAVSPTSPKTSAKRSNISKQTATLLS